MNRSLTLLPVALAALALAACGGNADDRAADNITAMTENRADQLEDAADNTSNGAQEEALEDRADATREMGQDAADKADNNDDARVEDQVKNAM